MLEYDKELWRPALGFVITGCLYLICGCLIKSTSPGSLNMSMIGGGIHIEADY